MRSRRKESLKVGKSNANIVEVEKSTTRNK